MARAGRKRKKNAVREPNGRESRRADYQKALRDKQREETEEQAMETAIAARLRAGIPKELAKAVGTIEGCLFANGTLNRDQYDAAVYYNMVRVKYLSAIDDPHSPRDPRKPSQGSDEDAFERFCAGAIQKWEAMRSEIMETQRQLGNTANLFGALDSLERGHLSEFQLGDLRYALNSVHRYRVSEKKTAA